uniref:Uncharacterized protein n=1 Tax=Nothobranchius kadleci TaxID=1051664 RepID=A0A1A8BIB2_NOTKA
MASFRFSPFTISWVTTLSLIKKALQRSSLWRLLWDSLVTPDSSTALHTAVECYDPLKDACLCPHCHSPTSSSPCPYPTTSLLLPALESVYVLGSIQKTGKKLLLQCNTKQDSWTEMLLTLTRADEGLPILYFLGATDELLVIGGNNSENIVTSFCVQSKKWGQVHRTEKVAHVGQGTLVGNQLLMPSIDHNTVIRMDLQTVSISELPPLPVSSRYEAVFLPLLILQPENDRRNRFLGILVAVKLKLLHNVSVFYSFNGKNTLVTLMLSGKCAEGVLPNYSDVCFGLLKIETDYSPFAHKCAPYTSVILIFSLNLWSLNGKVGERLHGSEFHPLLQRDSVT